VTPDRQITAAEFDLRWSVVKLLNPTGYLNSENLSIIEQNVTVRTLIRIKNEVEAVLEAVLNTRRIIKTVSETESIQENVTVYQFIMRFILAFKTRIVRNSIWISRIRRTVGFKTRRRNDR
jgi:hypothetical protein